MASKVEVLQALWRKAQALSDTRYMKWEYRYMNLWADVNKAMLAAEHDVWLAEYRKAQPVELMTLMSKADGTVATIAECAFVDAIQATVNEDHSVFSATVNSLMADDPRMARLYHSAYQAHTTALRCQSENTEN